MLLIPKNKKQNMSTPHNNNKKESPNWFFRISIKSDSNICDFKKKSSLFAPTIRMNHHDPKTILNGCIYTRYSYIYNLDRRRCFEQEILENFQRKQKIIFEIILFFKKRTKCNII